MGSVDAESPVFEPSRKESEMMGRPFMERLSDVRVKVLLMYLNA